MPDIVAERWGHSINAVGVCDNSIWVIVIGGFGMRDSYQDNTLLELSEEHNVTTTVIFFLPLNFLVIVYHTRKFRHLPLVETVHCECFCISIRASYVPYIFRYMHTLCTCPCLWFTFCVFHNSMTCLKPPHSSFCLLDSRSYCSIRHGYYDSDSLGNGSPFMHLKYHRIDIVYIGKREIVTDHDSNLTEIVS